MTRKTDQLARIEERGASTGAALGGLAGTAVEILDRLAALSDQVSGLAEVVQQVMASRGEHDAAVAADAKAARQSAEAAFAGVQSLAAAATRQPGPGELAAAIATNTEAVRQLHQLITTAMTPTPAPAVPAAPPAAEKARKT